MTWYVQYANTGNFLVPRANETTCVSQYLTAQDFILNYKLNNSTLLQKTGKIATVPNNFIQYEIRAGGTPEEESNDNLNNFKVVAYSYNTATLDGYLLQYHCDNSLVGIGRYETFIISSSKKVFSKEMVAKV